MSALFLLTAWRNTSSHPTHSMGESLVVFCSLHVEISALSPPFSLYGVMFALFLLTAWRNTCSHPVHCMKISLLSSCSLHGPALILLSVWRNVCSLPLTEWRNTCSPPVHCVEESLFSSYSLHGEMPAIILLPVRSNVGSSSCLLLGEIPPLILHTVRKISGIFLLNAWRNTCAQPCSLYGGMSALFLLPA